MISTYEFKDKRSLNSIDLNEVESIHNNDSGFFKFGDIYRGPKLNICFKSGIVHTYVFKNKTEQDKEYSNIKLLLNSKSQ